MKRSHPSPPPPSPGPPATTNRLLLIPDISYKWSHTLSGLLCLSSLTQHKMFSRSAHVAWTAWVRAPFPWPSNIPLDRQSASYWPAQLVDVRIALTSGRSTQHCYEHQWTLQSEHLLSILWCIHPGENDWVLLALKILITTELSATYSTFLQTRRLSPSEAMTCLSPELQGWEQESAHCMFKSREVLLRLHPLDTRQRASPNRFTWRPNVLPQEQSLCSLIIVSPDRKRPCQRSSV